MGFRAPRVIWGRGEGKRGGAPLRAMEACLKAPDTRGEGSCLTLTASGAGYASWGRSLRGRGRRRSARSGHAQSRKSPLLRDSAMRRGRHKMAAHGVKRLLSRSPHQTVAPAAPSPGTFRHTSPRLFTSSTPSLTLIPHLLLRLYNLQDIKNDSNPQVQPRQLRTLHSVRRRRYRGIPVPPPKNKQKKLMLRSHLRSPREVPSKPLQPPAKSRPTAQR